MEVRNDIGIKHGAHEHLLILNENYVAKEGDVCSGCREQIDSCKSFVYGCSNISSSTGTSTNGVQNECAEFLLHKTCAELPREIVNPTDPNEFLLFTPSVLPWYLPCITCGLDRGWFKYCSSLCYSYMCYKCAVVQVQLSTEDPKFEHPGHNHPLTLIQHPSSFKCYACKVNDNILDLSYRCTNCQFWIHKTCGDAPDSFQFQFHKHPLMLSFSLPPRYQRFAQHCRLCNGDLSWIEWLYSCLNCRYFTHFQCARSNSSPMLSSNEDETYPNMVHLPAADELSQNLLLEQFIKDKSITLSDSCNNNSSISSGTNYIKHWAHVEHDLKLITIGEFYDGKNDDDDEVLLICEGCVMPIRTDDSLSYYGCVPCKYFMHKFCAELPREIDHHLWPGKTLYANKYSQPFKYFYCGGCGVPCNGIFYCESVTPSDDGYFHSIQLHIGCVNLPKVIKHEAHHHQLDQIFDDHNHAYACYKACRWGNCKFKYGCEECKFYICGRCSMKARALKHRWDPHPLELIYDAGMVEEHEHEFECEYCSQEIDTNEWFYHCSSTCDLSFHPGCIQEFPDCKYKYIKVGATDIIKDQLHPHRLTFVFKVRSCEICGHKIRGEPVLHCAPCNVIFCLDCCNFSFFR